MSNMSVHHADRTVEEVIEKNNQKTKPTLTDYDGAWKRILDRYFPAFIEFFFPNIYTEIDWTRGYQVLDQELNKIARDSKLKKRLTDKLVKVWRHDGTEHGLLVHIEVQSQQERDFEKRLYIYYYRLRDYRDLPVATFAVLGDTTQEWKPTKYNEELWGTKLSFEYPIVKLQEYWKRWNELEQSNNPFATVVMAHLQAQESRKDPSTRYDIKLDLTRRLYKKGYERKEIDELFRFIDWLLWLPEELEMEYWQEVGAIEEEEGVDYLTTGERIGYTTGERIGYQRGLKEGEARGLKEGEARGLKRAEKLALQRVLDSKRKWVKQLIFHQFNPFDDGISHKLNERLELVQTEKELDDLVNLAFTQPTLDWWMGHLPEKSQVELNDVDPENLSPSLVESEDFLEAVKDTDAGSVDQEDDKLDGVKPTA